MRLFAQIVLALLRVKAHPLSHVVASGQGHAGPRRDGKRTEDGMNMAQASSKLRKLLGAKAAIKDGKRPSSPEQREQERAERVAANERVKAVRAAMDARSDALLAVDAEYQRLKTEFAEARAAQDRTRFGNYRRYAAGRLGGLCGFQFFHVEAEADTLAELLAAVETKQSRHRAEGRT
ncbi:MAG: hypothetical protein KGI71_06265 [Patescibacteria group bacterium]|nr:hypothetical protein [Patescibacteria group bacterium]